MKNSEMKRIKNFFLLREAPVIVVFTGMVLFFAFFTPFHAFLNPANLISITQLMPDLGVVTLGVGILMISGEFDLSVSSLIPLSSYIFVVLLRGDVSLGIILPIVLSIGALLGLLNGLITTKARIPSFIATLGTMMFWKGVLYVQSKMAPISIHPYLPPESWVKSLLSGKMGNLVPVQIIWFVFFAVILGTLLHFHKFGNWIYATGDNEQAAKARGINTDRVKIICFMIVGFLCAFVAALQILRLGSFAATQGKGFALKAIAGSVVGGTLLWGGVGSLIGIALGALTIQILENGLILMRVPVFGISAFIGSAIVLFVLLNSYLERRRKRI